MFIRTRPLTMLLPLLAALSLPLIAAAIDNDDALPLHDLPPFETRSDWQDDSSNALSSKSGYLQPARWPETSLSLAASLASATGVQMQRRGANALEPNIHGLGGDRVDVYWNGIYLPNASPTQTASPLNALGPGSVSQVSVFPLLAPVALGPLSAGARIELASDPLAPKQGDAVGFLFESDRNARQVWANLGQASSQAAYTVAAYANESGDYTGGDGSVVDADLESQGLSLSAIAQLNPANRFTLSTLYQQTDLSRNISLPLDTRSSDFLAGFLSHAYSHSNADARLTTKLGFSRSRPRLDNHDRQGAPFPISAAAESDSITAGLTYQREHPSGTDWQIGFDYLSESRDATRFRATPSITWEDRLWPDIESSNLGAYIQMASSDRQELQWRAGARVDSRWSEAKAADAPAIANGSVRDNYVRYNGPEASKAKRNDWLGGMNGEASWSVADKAWVTLGAGVARAAPSTTQRYRAFVNALGGGFEVGNPTLSPETSFFVKGQIERASELVDLRLGGFAKRIHDFIIRERIASLGPNDVYGFRPADTVFHGAEFAAVWRPMGKEGALRIPAAFAITEGSRADGGADLAEIPPWEASIGMLYTRSGFAAGANLRLAGSQRNPSPETLPIFHDTSSSAVVDLHASLAIAPQLRLELRLDNAFDELHYSYLQPPVVSGSILPSSGTLQPGDRIPLPGRSLSLAIDWEF